MSLTATILALVPAVIPFPKKPVRDPVKSQREADLEAALERARCEIDALVDEVERLRLRLDRLERYDSPGPQQMALAQYAQAQALAAANQQMLARQMMAMQNAYNPANGALHGLQGELCNCVPARHDMLMPRAADG